MLTSVSTSLISDTTTITVATPVQQDGRLAGVVAADFTTEQLSKILAETDLGGLGYVFLVSDDGTVLSHPERNKVGRKVAEILPGADIASTVAARVTRFDGEPVFVSLKGSRKTRR